MTGRRRRPRAVRPWRVLAGIAVLALAGGLVVWRVTGQSDDPPAGLVSSEEIVHLHGLGLNPKDGRIYLATHSGVLLVGGDGAVTRIADRYQDTMGFAVVGPDQFLASGHPDLRENKPPRLGLIRSDDAALSWESVSLGGESDLHAIVVVGRSIFAADATAGALLVSSDAGRTWSTLSNVELAVLAVEPDDAGTMVGTDFEGRILRSDDGGRTWRPTGGPVLVTLAWDSSVGLIGADASGAVFASTDAGSSWQQVGDLAGVGPVVTVADGVAYAATDGGKISRSSDGGRTWLPAE